MPSLKTSGLVLIILSTILIIIALATDYWLDALGGHFGIWRFCSPIGCFKLGSGAVINTVQAFTIISMLLLLLAALMQILSSMNNSDFLGMKKQKLTALLSFSAGVSAIIAMSVFTQHSGYEGASNPFSWSYALGWASAGLSLVAGVVAYLAAKQEVS